MTDAVTVPVSERAAMLRRPWSLQARLMATVIGIVALILVGSAVAIGAGVGDALSKSLNANLEATTRQLQLFEPGPMQNVRDADDVLSTGRQTAGYLLLVDSPFDGVSAAVVDEDLDVTPLTAAQTAALTRDAAGRGLSTVTVQGLGSYRVTPFKAGTVTGIAGLPLSELESTIAEILTTILLVTIGGLLLLGVAVALVIRRSLAPLRAVADTATRVAALPLAEGDVTIAERVPAEEADDRTEIGRVGAALNTLLDHVGTSLTARQRNEERMRAFVADASHELRTPLASIRGYSELSLRGIRQSRETTGESRALAEATAQNTEQALERIQAQSLRMTALVEDLLLLARLDEGKELVYGAVDLTRLAVESVTDARAAGPDHAWALEVDDAPVVVAGDASRLHQVSANLLANARVHTPPGTHVTMSVTVEEGSAVLRVQDDGPGIDPAIAGGLFERFARADVSRARQTGGTGLGLSIAKAIVEAHHGTITVDSRPGSTTFEVRLPARPADPAA
ncbi:cell wall metabolism sensor histidine kinase WalK [uncultured Microbacterium sp.]|uniref:histidine kinase n=1 Tax=uncultured Microbacterium sp. TaxID=191216 RepID=A0A1Y5NUK6_9MICO|nr:putative sensor histidine kinase TcrY [uncultured Microbacterium sp.]